MSERPFANWDSGKSVDFVPACRVYHDADQTIPNDTATVLSFNKERFDTDGIHDNTTNNSRLTCKTAGIYQITANVLFDQNAVGTRSLRILRNGSVRIGISMVDATAATALGLVVTTIYELAVNDYVEVAVRQASGGNLAVTATLRMSPEFMMVKVG